MGYYTQFSFNYLEGSEEDFRSLLEDIDGLLGGHDAATNESVYAKWYDHEKDMKALSEKYPDLTFSVEGDGEETMDLWQCFWHAGRSWHEAVRFTSYGEIRHLLHDEGKEENADSKESNN